jgi:hypothetical protein
MIKQVRFVVLLAFVFLTQSVRGQISLNADYSRYNIDRPITISFSNGPGNAADWIGIYKVGDVPGTNQATDWLYVNGTQTATVGISTGSVTFPAGLKDVGKYWVGFLENDGYNILKTDSIQVLDTLPRVTLNKKIFGLGDSIIATFKNGPGNPTDWIGIYHAGEVPGAPGIYSTLWAYVNGTQGATDSIRNGTIIFDTGLSEVGPYYVGFFLNDGYTFLDSTGFLVKSTDTIAPGPPTNVLTLSGTFSNLVLWDDVVNEPDAKYNVYYSTHQFSSVDSTIDDVPPYDWPVKTGSATHLLRAPGTDQNVTYYYGVNATDLASNVGPIGGGLTPVTTMAKGVPTISETAPQNFVADGEITEWIAAGIKPVKLNAFGANPTAHVVTNTAITDSNDLRVDVYMAMDANNLYIAYDVVDDIVSVDTSAGLQTWNQDSPDLNIGLYDWRGPHHKGYARGATPDYMLRFSKNRINDDHWGTIVMYPGANYVWKEKGVLPGYIVEAKIPFTTFAAIPGSVQPVPLPLDQVFVPRKGMRIPIDFSINDRDGGTGREGILSYSTLNNDNSWQNMYNWTYTWIGNQWLTGVQRDEAVPGTYELSQNYPNPFNPTTNIRFSVAQSGNVSLKLYDVLGREVAALVNERKAPGRYEVKFDGGGLASGVYFYRLQAGNFIQARKLLLLR